MSETITLARGLDMETLRSRADWRYLLDPSLPVRPPTEAEAEAYALRQEDGTYAALLDGTPIDLPGASAAWVKPAPAADQDAAPGGES